MVRPWRTGSAALWKQVLSALLIADIVQCPLHAEETNVEPTHHDFEPFYAQARRSSSEETSPAVEAEKVVKQTFDELLLSADPQAFQAFLSHALEKDDRNTLVAAEMATRLFEMVADLKDRMRQEDEVLDDDSINHN